MTFRTKRYRSLKLPFHFLIPCKTHFAIPPQSIPIFFSFFFVILLLHFGPLNHPISPVFPNARSWGKLDSNPQSHRICCKPAKKKRERGRSNRKGWKMAFRWVANFSQFEFWANHYHQQEKRFNHTIHTSSIILSKQILSSYPYVRKPFKLSFLFFFCWPFLKNLNLTPNIQEKKKKRFGGRTYLDQRVHHRTSSNWWKKSRC